MHKPFHVKNKDTPWTPTASPSGRPYFSFPSQPELCNGCQYSLFSLPYLPLNSRFVPASTSSLSPEDSQQSYHWLSHTNQIDAITSTLPLPQHHFPFLFGCAFYMPTLCFSRHPVLGSMLFFWLLNSLFSASSYKSTHPLSVGPQSLLTPHLVPRETDNYMTFLATSIGFYLFHQNWTSHQCSPVA